MHGEHVETGHDAHAFGEGGGGGEEGSHLKGVAGDALAAGEARERPLIGSGAPRENLVPAVVAFHVGQANTDVHKIPAVLVLEV